MTHLKLRAPDDFHIHLRDNNALKISVPHVASQFRRALVMPNLNPPVCTVIEAHSYRERILRNLPINTHFEPLMCLYLTDDTKVDEVWKVQENPYTHAFKLYPAHATTNSNFGVTNIEKLSPVFEAMQKAQVLLLIHGETSAPEVDIFDREKRFIDDVLKKLTENFPTLKIVLEHITTGYAVDYVKECTHLAATITPHHMLLNRNDLLAGGIRPHHYCMPIVKREIDRQKLLEAAISGHPRFFLGTDSAPHTRSKKESACGCAGIYTAPFAVSLLAEIFENHQALSRLEDFTSTFGAKFYNLPLNEQFVTLTKNAHDIPASYMFDADELIPFKAGEKLAWSLTLEK